MENGVLYTSVGGLILGIGALSLAETQMPNHLSSGKRPQLEKTHYEKSMYPESILPDAHDKAVENNKFVPILKVPHAWNSYHLQIGKDGEIYYRNERVTQLSSGELRVKHGDQPRTLNLVLDKGFIFELAWLYLNRGKRWVPKVVSFLYYYLGFRKQKDEPKQVPPSSPQRKGNDGLQDEPSTKKHKTPGNTQDREPLKKKLDLPRREITKRADDGKYPPTDNTTTPDVTDVPSFLNHVVSQRCIQCHDGNSETGTGMEGSKFPSFLSNWDEWNKLLVNSSSPSHKTAKNWLKSFVGKVAHGSMLNNVSLSPHSGPGKKIAGFLIQQGKRHLGKNPQDDMKLGSNEMIAKVDPKRLPEYFNILRNMKVADPEVRELLDGFDIIYDKFGAPPWSWAPHESGHKRIGQVPLDSEPPEFPQKAIFEKNNGKWNWREPFQDGFAIDASTEGLKKFFLIKFPRDEHGKIIKGIAGTVDRKVDVENDIASLWGAFPKGTIVAEVLYSTSLGAPIAIDLLTRKKVIKEDGAVTWAPDAHRADATPEAILQWVRSQPDYASNPDLKKIEAAVKNPMQDAIVSRLGEKPGAAKSFIINGKRSNSIPATKSVLPKGIKPSLIRRMYSEIPMTSALGSTGWQLEVQDLFRNSHRGIPINGKTCANCHNMAGERFVDIFKDSKISPHLVTFYGNMGGYDSVLSAMWHSKEALSKSGEQVIWEMDPDWGKFFENYNKTKHKADMYRRTEHLAITGWDLNRHPLRNTKDARE